MSVSPPDDELQHHLLRDNQSESISRGQHFGSGTLSFRTLRKLQSEVCIQSEKTNKAFEVAFC